MSENLGTRIANEREAVQERHADAVAELLTEHGCEVDYDGLCVGCWCGPRYRHLRNDPSQVRDHAWHARHLVEVMAEADLLCDDPRVH